MPNALRAEENLGLHLLTCEVYVPFRGFSSEFLSYVRLRHVRSYHIELIRHVRSYHIELIYNIVCNV